MLSKTGLPDCVSYGSVSSESGKKAKKRDVE
jgi:hypothetical protein